MQTSILTNAPENLGSIHFRERNIKDDNIRFIFPEPFNRLQATRKFDDLVLILENGANNQPVIRIVVNYSNLAHLKPMIPRESQVFRRRTPVPPSKNEGGIYAGAWLFPI